MDAKVTSDAPLIVFEYYKAGKQIIIKNRKMPS